MVGCGDIARYVAVFAHLSREFKLTACCDRTQENAERFARRYRIPAAYADMDTMLDREALDAVYLAVPHDLHAPMVQQCIDKGLPVLLEKPLTPTLAEGIKLVTLATQAGVKVGVNYQYRYDTGCYRLARAVQDGALGRIYTVRCNLAWFRDAAYFEQATWHRSLAQAGGGTLITQASHLVDIALWACGERPIAATGVTAQHKFTGVEVEDTAQGTVELANGTLIHINSTMAAHKDHPLSIEVYGEYGSAMYSNKPRPHVTFSGVNPSRFPVHPGGVHALQRSMRGFAQWVLDDRPYLTPAREALPALAAVDGIYRAAREQRRVSIHVTF